MTINRPMKQEKRNQKTPKEIIKKNIPKEIKKQNTPKEIKKQNTPKEIIKKNIPKEIKKQKTPKEIKNNIKTSKKRKQKTPKEIKLSPKTIEQRGGGTFNPLHYNPNTTSGSVNAQHGNINPTHFEKLKQNSGLDSVFGPGLTKLSQENLQPNAKSLNAEPGNAIPQQSSFMTESDFMKKYEITEMQINQVKLLLLSNAFTT